MARRMSLKSLQIDPQRAKSYYDYTQPIEDRYL